MRRLQFGFATLLLLPLLAGVGMWYFNKPQRVIYEFKDSFARGDIETVNRLCTNARFSVDTPGWEGSLMRHYPLSASTVPHNWSDIAQEMYDDFRESHVVASERTISDWWQMRREFQFASAHTRTPPDRTAVGGFGADTQVFEYWDYRDPISGAIVENWTQDGDHNQIFKHQRNLSRDDCGRGCSRPSLKLV